ncbi:hypothetical protein [Streptomyces fulvoviolaceus]|uniref:hypothetical protein n=1 Tax=Streptomyces fulvoviolaceus TaxID=285535 RepID=UPI0036F2F104
MPQQSQRGQTGPTPPTPPTATRLSRRVALTGSLVVFSLATACSGGGEDTPATGKASKTSAAAAAGVVAPAKIEVIAGLAGCEAEIRIEADELREGVCRTKSAAYRITTFPEEKLKEDWLEAASVYGGKYLVGPRWVVSARPKLLEQARAKLGGTIRQLS